MAVLEILKYPHPVLRKKAEPVSDFDQDLRRLISDMTETMYAAEGIGLAAPQIGVSRRLVVVDLLDEERKRSSMALVNPEIVEAEGEEIGDEACLSVIDYSAKVKRFLTIRVKARDSEGRDLDFTAEGRFARVIQHELDHLDGTLFIDRISALKRTLYKKKLKKILRSQGR